MQLRFTCRNTHLVQIANGMHAHCKFNHSAMHVETRRNWSHNKQSPWQSQCRGLTKCRCCHSCIDCIEANGCCHICAFRALRWYASSCCLVFRQWNEQTHCNVSAASLNARAWRVSRGASSPQLCRQCTKGTRQYYIHSRLPCASNLVFTCLR